MSAQPERLEGPVLSRNLSPLYQHLGIPVLRSAQTLNSGSWTLTSALNIASHSVRERDNGRSFELDGETTRVDIELGVGLSDKVTLNLNVPYLGHSGGHLDSVIDGWHAFFGLPDGARDNQPRDVLRFALGDPAIDDLQENATGLGDLELGLTAQVMSSQTRFLAVSLQHKFSSGDEDRFLGSGVASTAITINATARNCGSETLSCHAQLGLVYLDGSPFVQDTRDFVPYTSLGIAWRFASSLALLGQVDYHGVTYRQKPLAANGAPLWGTLALRWRPSRDWVVDAGFAEDLAVGASPDINFRLGLTYRPQR